MNEKTEKESGYVICALFLSQMTNISWNHEKKSKNELNMRYFCPNQTFNFFFFFFFFF